MTMQTLQQNNTYRIGQVVPSSNVTMEIEIASMLRARETILPERFSCHSSRIRMRNINIAELKAMNQTIKQGVRALLDADIDIIAFACLVAIMAEGHGAHHHLTETYNKYIQSQQSAITFNTSAGALLNALKILQANNIVLIAPYGDDLTKVLIDYLTHENFNVIDYHNLSVTENTKVGRLEQHKLMDYVSNLKHHQADVIVISACVQMPSLTMIEKAETEFNKPVISAATATMFQLLKTLKLSAQVPNAGKLLSGIF